MRATTKKSPLKALPLRNPGQSLDDRIGDIQSSVVTWIFVLCLTLFYFLNTWTNYISKKPPNPFAVTIVSIIVVSFSGWKLYQKFQELQRIKMARDGEKVIGQYLEKLRASGADVFHDIPGDKFNIDHAVISPHGIYLIETKTLSKPAKGEAKIWVKDNQVYANGYQIERNPLDQSRALASWLADLITETTGKKFPVRPVVVFPGWFVERLTGKEDVWVLNPKALPTFIENTPASLSPENVRLICYHLSRYIRHAQINT